MPKGTWLAVAALAAGGCSRKDSAPPSQAAEGRAGSATPAKPDAVAPRAKLDGPAVAPVITDSIAFVVPKDAGWSGERELA